MYLNIIFSIERMAEGKKNLYYTAIKKKAN